MCADPYKIEAMHDDRLSICIWNIREQISDGIADLTGVLRLRCRDWFGSTVINVVVFVREIRLRFFDDVLSDMVPRAMQLVGKMVGLGSARFLFGVSKGFPLV
jgi:hypothetical protein